MAKTKTRESQARSSESVEVLDTRALPRVLLVDDHQVVRSGLRTLLELEDDLTVIGEAETAAQAIECVEADPPDLVVMDVRLPDRSGISACHEIRQRFPEVKVLILTSFADPIALASAMNARASGYVLKNVRSQDLIADMRRAVAGETVFDRVAQEPEHPLSHLSPQERALAVHLAEGLTNREIAMRMDLAEKTVKNYVSNVLTKLGMTRRSEAAAFVSGIQAKAGALLGDHPDLLWEVNAATDPGKGTRL